MKSKMKNKKGFTLAELLIVVAIISVLVAISFPIFSGKLVKAKIATNQANYRSAKAAAAAEYLTNGKTKKTFYEYNVATSSVKAKRDNEPAFSSQEEEEREGEKLDIITYFYVRVDENGASVAYHYDYISDPKNYK